MRGPHDWGQRGGQKQACLGADVSGAGARILPGAVREHCRNEKIPKAIEDFASVFAELQRRRHFADYDPLSKFSKSAILVDAEFAERAMKEFKSAPKSDRRAFCAWVLLRAPRR